MTLSGVLHSVGKPATPVIFPDGSRIILLPYGARVLGLYATNDERNFLWTNPSLTAEKSARRLFVSNSWHNSGGDRTWIAPEIDIFFPKFPSTEMYVVPRQLDPGGYEPGGRNGISYENTCTLDLSRSQRRIRLKILKSWNWAPNPLRYETIWERMESVQYAGYTQRTTLQLVGGSARNVPPVGIWNILQLPPGGTFFAGTHMKIRPTLYFGTISRRDLVTNREAVRYSMNARGIQKIGIRANATTGRAGYLYKQGGSWALVVRNFFVDPSGEYVDAPWHRDGHIDDHGTALQACNVNCDLGRFAELEYHAPAVRGNTGRRYHEDVSQVWAFRGPRKFIEMIAHGLVSPLP